MPSVVALRGPSVNGERIFARHRSSIRAVQATAGAVLVGGRSTRMGRPKAALEWHGSTLLRRTTGVLERSVDGPVLVVRAAGQQIPDPGPRAEIHDDEHEGLGPLHGIAVALAAASGRADVVFICSTDLPFLHVAFVQAVLRSVTGRVDVALPQVRGFPQPLAAAYRTALAPLAADLVDRGRLRPAFLFEQCRVRRLDEADLLADPGLAARDPRLDSVVNVNEPADYDRARSAASPEVVVRCLGGPARGGEAGPRAVRARTLSEAADAVRVRLDRHVGVAVDGDPVTGDPHLPLMPGDTVTFVRPDPG